MPNRRACRAAAAGCPGRRCRASACRTGSRRRRRRVPARTLPRHLRPTAHRIQPPAASAPCCRGRRDHRQSGESATSALNLASPAADTADMRWCSSALALAAVLLTAGCSDVRPLPIKMPEASVPRYVRVKPTPGGPVVRVPLEDYVRAAILSEFAPPSGDPGDDRAHARGPGDHRSHLRHRPYRSSSARGIRPLLHDALSALPAVTAEDLELGAACRGSRRSYRGHGPLVRHWSGQRALSCGLWRPHQRGGRHLGRNGPALSESGGRRRRGASQRTRRGGTRPAVPS